MSKPLTASGGSVTASLSLFNGRATVSLSAPMVELDQEEKLDFFGKGEVPQHAYGIPLDDNQPVIWSVQHSELQADPGEMAAARANYRSDLEDFFEGAEWISDATVANSQGRNWELLEFRTSVLHRWVYLTSWEGRILSCEFNVFGNVDGSGIVLSLFDSLMLD